MLEQVLGHRRQRLVNKLNYDRSRAKMYSRFVAPANEIIVRDSHIYENLLGRVRFVLQIVLSNVGLEFLNVRLALLEEQ